MSKFSTLITIYLLMVCSGCAQYQSTRGVDVNWGTNSVSNLELGSTTRNDVLELLGPPSQVIANGDETVLYYLNESAEGRGLLLIFFNRLDIETRYDRAIFFFDERDLLTDFSTRIHLTDE